MEDETMEVEQEYEAPRLVDILDSDDSSRISDAIKDVFDAKVSRKSRISETSSCFSDVRFGRQCRVSLNRIYQYK